MLQFVGELNIMPILVLACRMCPKHIEATMYAMLMSTINFGNQCQLFRFNAGYLVRCIVLDYFED